MKVQRAPAVLKDIHGIDAAFVHSTASMKTLEPNMQRKRRFP